MLAGALAPIHSTAQQLDRLMSGRNHVHQCWAPEVQQSRSRASMAPRLTVCPCQAIELLGAAAALPARPVTSAAHTKSIHQLLWSEVQPARGRQVLTGQGPCQAATVGSRGQPRHRAPPRPHLLRHST